MRKEDKRQRVQLKQEKGIDGVSKASTECNPGEKQYEHI
jgi:hypothetical protein